MDNQPAPLWATNRENTAVLALYNEQPEWRPMIRNVATGTAAERQEILLWAKAWQMVKYVVPLALAEKRWGVANLRQNSLDHPYRWKAGSVWLTTVPEMERCYGAMPTQEAHHATQSA